MENACSGESRTKLLLVEDHPQDISLLQDFFGDQFEILVAETIEVAWALVEKHSPSIVLVDLFVPYRVGAEPGGTEEEPPGLSFMRELKHRFPGVAAVVFTGYLNQVNVRSILDAGAIEYVEKGSTKVQSLSGMLRNIDSLLRAREDSFRRIGDGVRATLEDVQRNIELARQHNARVFGWTVAACVAGLFVVLGGACLLFFGYVSSGVVLSVGGLIPEVIGGLFFRHIREENTRLDRYHQHLLHNQRLLTLIDACNTIEGREPRDRAKAELIKDVVATLK